MCDPMIPKNDTDKLNDNSTIDLTIYIQSFDETYGFTVTEMNRISIGINNNNSTAAIAILMKIIPAVGSIQNPRARTSYFIESPTAAINKEIYKALNKDIYKSNIENKENTYGSLNDYLFIVKEN